MSYVKISELTSLSSADLNSANLSLIPVVADVTGSSSTYKTTVANVKTYVETGNLNVTGAVFANLESSFENLTIRGNLNVQGTTTSTSSENLSTNSSVIDLHTFSSNLDPWTSDDGRDIGLRFFYYKSGSAGTSALVWENDNTYLTWYGSNVGNANTGLVSGTLGTMQVGELILGNSTISTSATTGAIRSNGGAGISGNIYSGENIVSGGQLISTANVSTANYVFGNIIIGNSIIRTSSYLYGGYLQVNNSSSFGTTIVVAGTATVNALTSNGTVTTGNVIPLSANTYTIGNSSSWYSSVYATAIQAKYADLAEKYIPDADYGPGTVVVFGGINEITVTDVEADTRVAGAVSTDPAYLMNEGSSGAPVALRGKTPVKVVGSVEKGDLLVTSNITGYATSHRHVEVYNQNAVFAKSLENDSNENERTIWAVIL